MRKLLTPTAAMLFGITAVSLYAGDQLYNFDFASGDPRQIPGFILVGNRANVAWQLSNGAGDPSNSGYLQGTDAAGSESFGIFFPDVDLYTNSLGNVVSLPVKAFKFEMDLRVGNGTYRPADGFSISFCRQNDPALLYAANGGNFGRWAGGDSVATANDHTGLSGGNPESGTRTGLAISFDTWEGNWLATNPNLSWTNSSGSNDREGMNIRLDDVTLAQIGMTNRNGNCAIVDGVETIAGCATTSPLLTNSLQTGPWSGTAAQYALGNGGASDGTFNNLTWQHLIAEFDTNKQITITFKGQVILDHYQVQNFPTSQGRLALAGRTGGSWEHTHFDNVHITTVPAIQPVFQSIAGLTNGFQFTILNIGAAQVTNFNSVTFDGTNVTAQTVRSNYVDVATYGIYTQTSPLVARSTHSVTVVYRDALGQQFTNTSNFQVPFFLDLPASQAIALTDIDTTRPGFVIRPFQSYRVQPNALNFTEDLLAGFRGPNDVDQTVVTGGVTNWTGVPRFSNGNGGALFSATFGNATNWKALGIGTGVGATPNYYDNCAMEMTGYLYFPNAGTYTMYIGSDDGYRLTFSSNPADRMGTAAAFFDGGRGLAEPGDPFLLAVPQAGAYPFRLIWENGGGGADFEWYTGIGTNYTLINDTSSPDAVLAYQAALPSAQLGAYVKRANPGRDAGAATFFQPILVDLGNGNGSHTVNSASIALTVDGVAQTLTRSNPDSSTTRVLSQMGNNLWSVGLHTNVLTFADNAAQNYSYTWTWTVMNVQPTNTVVLPVSLMQPASAVDTSKRGFRVHSYQSAWESPNYSAWSEMQLQGLHGPNLAIAPFTGTYWKYGDPTEVPNDGSEGYGAMDFHYSANNSGVDNPGNAMGQYRYNYDFKAPFGLGASTLYRFGTYLSQATECSALEFGAWLVFPSPGYYILHVGSDDGEKLQVPLGNLFAKIGIPLTEANVGRGIAGPSSGMPGGEYAAIQITQAGAYPFRLLYENGGTDGALELDVYKVFSDGSVGQVLINQENNSESIMAYQGLTSGVETLAPYVSYANPVFDARDVTYWQPIVVEVTDGASPKTLNTTTVRLTVDGIQHNVTITQPSAGVNRIVQQNPYWGQLSATHTAVLTYADNSGANYTNTWPFTVMNLMPNQNNVPGVVVDVPATSMVPVSSLDTTQPGFRVYPYQTTAGNDNSPGWTEDQFLGLKGPNIADLSLATNNQYYTWNDVIDFADGYNHAPYTTDSSNGEFRYNYQFSNFGLVSNGGGVNTNNASLIFAGYMVFDTPGTYAMAVNSDDGFKVTVPFANPLSFAGTTLGWYSGGRGNSGSAMPPTGGSRTHFIFRIPTAGAYPIRCLYENGGGGLNVEWTLYRYLPDGSVARTIVGDTNYPGVQVYQVSSKSGPYIVTMDPNINRNLTGDGLQVMNLGRNRDMTIVLTNGATTLDVTSPTFTVAGVSQPLTVTQSGGITTIVHYGTNALPSGYYGPAVLTYKDSAGQTFTVNWTIWSQNYYGTVVAGAPLGSGDEAQRGFLLRPFQASQDGSSSVPTRVYAAEELLAGIWTNNNVANLTSNTVNGYFRLAGTGPTNGLINFNYQAPGTGAGDFQVGTGYQDMQFPGMPTLGSTAQNSGFNSFAFEALAYVEFPTNGTYVMGVNSDDGFRVTRGWGAPTDKGALIVNSPSSVAGTFQATLPSMGSRLLTNAITGKLVQAFGVGNGSTIPAEACGDISNASDLAGNIALIFRGTCGFVNKVQNAAAAGATAVIIVNNRPPAATGEGWFSTEMGIGPIQAIPAVMITLAEGNNLSTAISNGVVNVTLTPLDDLVNPGATSPVLGEADFGKGSSDVLFNVTVPQAGVYPLRLTWFQGGGGANCEWFSMVDTNRVLLNDATSTNGPALKAYMQLSTPPTMTVTVSGNTMTFNFNGTLQSATDLNGPWTDIWGQPPLSVPISTVGNKFFRTR